MTAKAREGHESFHFSGHEVHDHLPKSTVTVDYEAAPDRVDVTLQVDAAVIDFTLDKSSAHVRAHLTQEEAIALARALLRSAAIEPLHNLDQNRS